MNTAFSLDKKTILITGATSGIGRECAIKCSEAGAQVIVTGRNKERLAETFEKLSGNSNKAILCDLLNESQLSDLVKQCEAVDGVIHCAGVVKPFPIGFLNEDKIEENLNINFKSVVLLTTALFKAKKINPKASIVFISSIAGQHPHKGGSMYASSKAALEAFCKTVALEYSAQQIRANCICPAMVKTPVFEAAENIMTKETMAEHIAKYPLGVGYPDDVAHAAVYLLSPASKWITGINLIMDGGLLLNY